MLAQTLRLASGYFLLPVPIIKWRLYLALYCTLSREGGGKHLLWLPKDWFPDFWSSDFCA